MSNLMKIAAACLLATLVMLQVQVSGLKSPTPLGGATFPNVVALFESSLASKITSSATTATLVTGTDKQGVALSGTYGFIIDEGASNEEFVVCSATGTALTGCTRGVSVTDGKTSVTALKFEHRRGASVKVTDHPQLAIITRALNGQQGLPNQIYYTDPNIAPVLASGSIPTWDYVKNYADGLTFAGTSNASTITKGIVEQATVSEFNAGTGTGATGARLFIGPSEWASSSFAISLYGNIASVSSTNKVLSRQNIWGSVISATSKLFTASLTASASGDTLFRNGSGQYINLAIGTPGQSLTASASGLPAWEYRNRAYTIPDPANVTDGAETTVWTFSVPKGSLAVASSSLAFRQYITDWDVGNAENPVLRLKYGGSTIASFTLDSTGGLANYCGIIEGGFNSGGAAIQTGAWLYVHATTCNAIGASAVIAGQQGNGSAVNANAAQDLVLTIDNGDGSSDNFNVGPGTLNIYR